MMNNNPHIGSSLENFLAEENIEAEINSKIAGFTNVISLELSPFKIGYLVYNLDLKLANLAGKVLRLQCERITNLNIKDLSGQFMVLRCQDIREQQLDALKYRFVDLENEAISFFCARVEFTAMDV